MYGANCRASSNLMQWTYASLRSFTSYCPTCFLTVDFPSLLRSSVNLTFGRKRCSESVVVSLLHLLLPCFSQGIHIDETFTTLAGDGSSRVSLISEFSCTVLPSRILGVRRCGWTYEASLHVHLTLRTKRCSESVVISFLHLLLPCSPGTLGE